MKFKQVNVHEEVYEHIKGRSIEENIPIARLVAHQFGFKLKDIYKTDYSDMELGEVRQVKRGTPSHMPAVRRAVTLGYRFTFDASVDQFMSGEFNITRIE
jgi:hypothetical protein